jgi:hypothetical protein
MFPVPWTSSSDGHLACLRQVGSVRLAVEAASVDTVEFLWVLYPTAVAAEQIEEELLAPEGPHIGLVARMEVDIHIQSPEFAVY